ncbi:MAG: DNA mismatch repair endonuclease MutL [Planctomycetia bacterium]|nr:DNA mismatch repair endonuclease MutL [Planctomycetia bacterium]
MASRIRQLDPTLVNQIAAGEVIERPGSALKEMLENAIDAGATQIDVEVAQGGIELIRVVDDGIGMVPEDLPLALSSHATSKVSTASDLEQICTLGFRGEALASIGSVAQVIVQSRTRELEQGAQLKVDGGNFSPIDAWNGRPGTRIEVRHLFYNLPARRKFLKTIPTEMGHISEAVIRLALGFPHVGISLKHNDRDVYDIPANSPLKERITRFFGEEIGDKLIEVSADQGPLKLSGYIAEPSVNRGNNRLQYFFVNGRCIRDRTLGHALQEGMHGLLMVGRYGIGFLYLEMPPDQVDVNVHPSKAEVRFRDNQVLHHLVRTAVRKALHGLPLHGSMSLPTATPSTAGNWQLKPPPAPAPTLFQETPRVARPTLPELSPPPRTSETAAPIISTTPAPIEAAEPAYDGPRALQFHNSYLVVLEGDGMLVIDQHALHERILYEQLKTRLQNNQLEIQKLLVPEPVELIPENYSLALAHQQALQQLGLEIQPFGGTTVLVSSYPAMLKRSQPAAMLRMVLEHLTATGDIPSVELLMDKLLCLMACHAAIKAGDRLTPAEMDALLAQRHLCADSHHCPHGRPTSLFFSKAELDKQFERI